MRKNNVPPHWLPLVGVTDVSQLFGWEKTGEFDMGPRGMYVMYGQGGEPYGGMMTRTPDMPPPNWLCYIHVPDAKESAIATDPQGAMTAVHSAKPQ